MHLFRRIGKTMNNITEQSLVNRLLARSTIRRGITTRKSVQNGEPDRLSDLLEEAAKYIHDSDSVSDLQIAFYTRLKSKYEAAVIEITDLQEQIAVLECKRD